MKDAHDTTGWASRPEVSDRPTILGVLRHFSRKKQKQERETRRTNGEKKKTRASPTAIFFLATERNSKNIATLTFSRHSGSSSPVDGQEETNRRPRDPKTQQRTKSTTQKNRNQSAAARQQQRVSYTSHLGERVRWLTHTTQASKRCRNRKRKAKKSKEKEKNQNKKRAQQNDQRKKKAR